MDSRWTINGRRDSNGLTTPYPPSNNSNTSPSLGGPGVASSAHLPLTYQRVATAQPHHSNGATASSPFSSVPLSSVGTHPPVQRPQAAAPQARPQLQSYAPPQTHVQNPYAYLGPRANPPAHGSHPESRVSSEFAAIVTKVLDIQFQKMTEIFLPQFNSLRADFSSLKNEIKEDVAKIGRDLKESDTATTKALKGFAEKAETLKAFLGETQLSYENGDGRQVTVMSRLDELYIALGEVIEKMADHEADLLESSSLQNLAGSTTGPHTLEAEHPSPEISTPARIAANLRDITPRPSHSKSPVRINQAPTPSSDVDMFDADVEPVPRTSVQPIEDSLNVALGSRPRSTSPNHHSVSGSQKPVNTSPASAGLGSSLESTPRVGAAQDGKQTSLPANSPLSKTSANASARGDTPAGTPLGRSRAPLLSNNASPVPRSAPQARPSPLIVEQTSISQEQEQQQPPTPISPVVTSMSCAYSLQTSSSLASLSHLLLADSIKTSQVLSPAMADDMLPELAYPTREPTAAPEDEVADPEDTGGDIVISDGEDGAEEEKGDKEHDGDEDEDGGEDNDMGSVEKQIVEVAEESIGPGSNHDESGPVPESDPGVEVEMEDEQNESHGDIVISGGEDKAEGGGDGEKDDDGGEDVSKDEDNVEEDVVEESIELGFQHDESGPVLEFDSDVEQEVEVEMKDERERSLAESGEITEGEAAEESADDDEVGEKEVEDGEVREEGLAEEDSQPQLEKVSFGVDHHIEEVEIEPIFENTDVGDSGNTSTSPSPVEHDEATLSAPKPTLPLFLPSRTGTMSPLPTYVNLEDSLKEEQEEVPLGQQGQTHGQARDEVEEQETTQSLLFSSDLTPAKPVLPRFSPPSSPRPPRESSPESGEDDLPPSAPPSPAPTSPVVHRKTPVIDVSQLLPSQPTQAPSSPCLSYADFPIGPDATATPTTATRIPGRTSSEEVHTLLTQHTTLSEPSSSEDEESEAEEDQVDELLPSEPSHSIPPTLPKWQQQQQRWLKSLATRKEAETEDVQTPTGNPTRSSIQTFTPQVVQPAGPVGDDSIRSFGASPPSQTQESTSVNVPISTLAPTMRQSARKRTGGKSPRKSYSSLNEYHEIRDCIPVVAQLEPTPQKESEPVQHLQPLPEPTPPPATVNSPVAPIPLTQPQLHNPEARNDRNRPQRPLTPVPLPEYISPVNSPSPVHSPPVRRKLGYMSTGYSKRANGRKRKLEELNSGKGNQSTPNQPQQQTQPLVRGTQTPSGTGIAQPDDALLEPSETSLLEREVMVRNTGRSAVATPITNNGSGSGSSITRANPISRPTTNKNKIGTLPSLQTTGLGSSVEGGGRQKKQKREESPIYISSTPNSPTEGRGKGKEKSKGAIDLTETPSPPPTQIRALAPDNAPSRSGTVTGASARKAGNANANAPKTGPKSKAQREKERREEQERKEAAEQEKRETERKRKREKEKKMLPIGAEDSDEAEVIPAKSYKKPQADEDEGGSAERRGRPTAGKGPYVDLSKIAAKQKENEKASKAQTKVKRKKPVVISSSFAGISTSTLRSRDDDEPPLKKAKIRTGDKEPVVSSGNTERKRPSKNKEEPGGNGEGKKKPNPSQQKRNTGFNHDPRSSPIRTSWPVKKAGSRFDKNFVECDLCNTWYHYGCVGIKMGDRRLEDGQVFVCPPCSSDRFQGTASPKKKHARGSADECGRPDCGFHTVPDEDEYFVKRIIGKRVKHEGGRGRVEEWLVEWEGYPISDSTWERETSMANPMLLIESFVMAATKEGIDLDEDPDAVVLLKAARKGGFVYSSPH